jgi:hypothetical protein
MTCNGESHKCTIDCNEANCNNKTLCGDQLDCIFLCPEGMCTGTKCATSTGSCDFRCSGGSGGTHCSNVHCAAKSCSVTCDDSTNACNGVFVDGGNNEVKCLGNDKVTCDNVSCVGGGGANDCRRTCGPGAVACGPVTSCEPPGSCGGWEEAGAPDGGGGN